MVRVNESNFNPANEADAGYGQLISVLVRRRWWLLGVLCGVLSLATVYSVVARPKYESTMQLLIEPNYEGKSRDIGQAANQSDQFADSNVKIDDIATQINVMRSSLLIQRAVDLLSNEYPDLTVEKIKRALTLSQVAEQKVETKIVEAVYIDKDPIKTQKVLQAILRVYQIYNREQQEQRLRKGLRFINDQIPSVRKQVDESESKLEQFRKRNNLIDPEQQATAITQSLNAIEQERQAVRAQYQDNQSRYNELQKQLASSPQKALTASRLSQSQRYQSILNELQKTELVLSQRATVFTDEDPTIKRFKEQRQSQIEMLRAEVQRVLGADAASQVKEKGEGILTQGQLGGLDLNLTSELVAVQTNMGALKARDDSLAKTQQDFRQQLDRFPVLLAEYNRLVPLVQINRDKLQQLLRAQQELSLEIARGGFDWQALENPLLGEQVAPNMKINLLLGLVVGLMLGSFAAFIREAVDDSVRSVEDLEQQIALPMLGMLPEMTQGKAGEQSVTLPFGEPQVATAPWTVQVSNWPPSWEALDLIYKNIQLLNTASCFRSLMITSALAGEGKSTLALGLALSAARLHQRVLLIDADLRCPNLHRMLNLPNEQGLSTLLSNDVSLPSRISIESSGSYIDVLTAGPVPKDPANLLSSHRMRELMTKFEEKYDLVLLDAPPVLGMVDPILAASSCSGVVLVSRVGQVSKTELAQATTMLTKLNIIGVVANGVSQTANSYASYNREREREKEKGVVLNKVWG